MNGLLSLFFTPPLDLSTITTEPLFDNDDFLKRNLFTKIVPCKSMNVLIDCRHNLIGRFQMKMLLILCLPLFLVACSGEKTAQEHVHDAATESVEAASDLRQEACEMVDGKLECAVERAEREVEDAVE